MDEARRQVRVYERTMGFIAMSYFFFVDGYSSGLAIYFGMMSNLSSMFINIGLYVLVGMVLKQTRLPELLLNVIKPYQLPAPMLASVIIFATAFPTASLSSATITSAAREPAAVSTCDA